MKPMIFVTEGVPALIDAYRAARHKRLAPREALAKAREMVTRSQPYVGGYPFPMTAASGNVSRQPDRPTYAWIESMADAGLRFVDHADKLAPRGIDHTGWFTDDDGFNGTLRGGVWRLPAHKGSERFVAGYSDPNNDGAAFVCLELVEDARSAAYQADSIAERAAEQERDYQRAFDAGNRAYECEEEAKAERRTLLALFAERKAVRGVADVPTICATLRTAVTDSLEKIAALRAERDKLRDACIWQRDAFDEGYAN